MVVFSDRRAGLAAELWVSAAIAREMLRATAAAARRMASDRWERELARWLAERSEVAAGIDASEIAWSPEHFEHQRQFVVDAIEHATTRSPHAPMLMRWRAILEAHPRAFVQFGRRWIWLATA